MKHLVYCLLRAEEWGRAAPPPGIDGCAVRAVGDASLAAAASHVPDSCAAPSVARARAYARVVEAIHRACTVLPMRYGCLPASEAQVLDLLRRRRAGLLAALGELDGCVEMGARVLLPGAGERQAARPACGQGASSGRAYLAGRQSLYGAQDRGEHAAARVAEHMRRALDGLFVRWQVERRVARHPALLSVQFLVRRGALSPFCDAFGCLAAESRQPMLLTGPWPPYSFAGSECTAGSGPEPCGGNARAIYGAPPIGAAPRFGGTRGGLRWGDSPKSSGSKGMRK